MNRRIIYNLVMRAESIIKVTQDMAEIIRKAKLTPELARFDADYDSIRVIDVHNSWVQYIWTVLPVIDPHCKMADGSYRCCQLMRRMAHDRFFNPRNKTLKWRILVRQMTEIEGVPVLPNPNPMCKLAPAG